MGQFFNYNILFLVAFVITAFLTRILTHILPSFGLVDIPNKRRAHSKITPRGGGIAIVTVLILTLTFHGYFLPSSISFFKFLPLLLIISMISFLDDLTSIPVYIRLIIHIICSAIAIKLLLPPHPLFNYKLPFYVDFLFIVISLTTFLNIYNFLDGIDGISCSESAHLAMTLLILCYLKYDIIIHVNLIVTLNIIILACSLSFLIFNWHPAKIFLGDVGSISLGFTLGVCLLLVSASSTHLFVASFIASLYYLADGGLTILIRLLKQEKIWQPHLQHFFQKAVKQGKTHKQIVSRIILCNILLMVLSITSLYFPLTSIIFAILTVMATIMNFTL